MSFPGRRKRSREEQKRATIVAITVAIAVGVQGVFVGSMKKGGRHTGDIGSLKTLAIFCALIAVPVTIFIIMKLRGSDEDDHARTEDSSDLQCDDDPQPGVQFSLNDSPLKLILVVLLVVFGFGAVYMLMAVKAHAQDTQGISDRGAFVALNGTDTIVVDRFNRTGDTLRGSVSVKAQPRIDYIAALGPNNSVRSLSIAVHRPTDGPTDAPLQQVTTTMQGDSAFVLISGTVMRIGTKAGAVPSLGNAFALAELFTRRASAAGGTGDYAYLNMTGLATLPVTVRAIGRDSSVVTIAKAEERFKVDATGRILGGFLVGNPVIITRVSEQVASRIAFGTSAAKVEKADYSAPAGASYTAEEVSMKGPGGITLGGTLTKPKNAKGPLPVAVTITGSGQEDRDESIPFAGGIRLFRQVADTLSRVGIAVLRLDDRGLGASTGNFAASTTADFADDTRAAVEWLRARPDIDGNRIALIGHSEGGMIAPMVSATDPKLRAIVIFAGPGDTMRDIILMQNQWSVDHTPGLSATQRDSLMKMAREVLTPEKQTIPAMKFWMGYDPGPTARKVKAATLILQGETDQQVPPANAEKLAGYIRSGGNKDVTVRLFPATNHLFVADPTGDPATYAQLKMNKVSPAIMGAMADWLVLKLGVK